MPRSTSIIAIAIASIGACTAASAMQNAAYGDPAQLFGAAGFKIAAGKPVNRCGTPANPSVSLLDMNGDGQKNEALFVDSGTCYAPDNAYFAIAARDGAGQPWHLLFAHSGGVRAVATRTQGWLDLEYRSGGKVFPLHYTGSVYATGATLAAPGAGATPAPPAGPATAMLSPATKPAALATAQRVALFKAAGAERKGSVWTMCADDPDVASATIDSIRDLNGDGRAEVLVTQDSGYCYGNTGSAFALIGQQADGSWKRLAGETGIATFLKTKGVGDWPDLEVGGPGFCFPVSRWNGSAYVFYHFNEYQKGICAQNGLKPAVRAY